MGTLEQISNNNSLRFFGITEDKNKICIERRIDLCNKKVGRHINKVNIDSCFRVGQVNYKYTSPLPNCFDIF